MSATTSRQTQHRQKKESKDKELSELKAENRTLRKQLMKLRKDLDRYTAAYQDMLQEAAEEKQTTLAETEGASKKGGGCDKCGSEDVASLPLPIGVLYNCRACGHRRVEK